MNHKNCMSDIRELAVLEAVHVAILPVRGIRYAQVCPDVPRMSWRRQLRTIGNVYKYTVEISTNTVHDRRFGVPCDRMRQRVVVHQYPPTRCTQTQKYGPPYPVVIPHQGSACSILVT
jgi:hypothetical protein